MPKSPVIPITSPAVQLPVRFVLEFGDQGVPLNGDGGRSLSSYAFGRPKQEAPSALEEVLVAYLIRGRSSLRRLQRRRRRALPIDSRSSLISKLAGGVTPSKFWTK